jgi:zinc-binding alcohol dehydrogenase/oxidoreductase
LNPRTIGVLFLAKFPSMKAYVLEAKDKPLTLKTVADPLLKAGMVQIRLKAAALNHRDLWIVKGQYAGIQYPVILGSDGAGVVEKLGKEVSGFTIGDKVIVNPSFHWGEDEAAQGKDFKILGLPDNGTLAELVNVPVEYVHPMPEHLTFVQAAALPLAGLTAYRALFKRAHTMPGDRVLITGIGGGVAQFALQFALAAGCETWVTSGSAAKLKLAMGMGAKGGGNYKEEGWAKKLREAAGGFDVIIDGAGGPGFGDLTELAGAGGRIAIYGGTRGNLEKVSPQRIFWKQLSILGSTMGSPSDFHNLLQFVNAHGIVPVIDEVFPFAEAWGAFEKMDRGEQVGKLVVEV